MEKDSRMMDEMTEIAPGSKKCDICGIWVKPTTDNQFWYSGDCGKCSGCYWKKVK